MRTETTKKKLAVKAYALASLNAREWSAERFLTGLAFESLVTSYGLSHDAANSIVKDEMAKRNLSNG